MDAEATHAGGCACGAIRYRASGLATNLCFCHCHSCRSASGAPFVAWATFEPSHFELTRGRLAEYASSRPVIRGCCRRCGTTLSYRHRARPQEIDLTLASLDDPGALPPGCHIWVSEKLPWVELADGLPQHARWRTGD